MNLINYRIGMLFVFVTCFVSAADEVTTPVNPALLYWQAIAEAPEITPEEEKVIEEVVAGKREPPALDASVIKTYWSMEMFLRHATTPARPCDWGLALVEGWNCTSPHIGKMRNLALRQIYLAEMYFSTGKTIEGIQRLLTAHVMARDVVGTQPSGILSLVARSIDSMAMVAAGRRCLSWDPSTRLAYLDRLRALPSMPSMIQAARGDFSFFDHFFLAAQKDPSATLTMNVNLRLKDFGVDYTRLPDLLSLFHDSAASQQSIVEYRQFSDTAISMLSLSRAAAQQGLKELEAQAVASSNLLVSQFGQKSISWLFPMYEGELKNKTRIIMLEAALTHGAELDPAIAATYRDALDGQPLRFELNADGIPQLLTAGLYSGKPVTLTLGPARNAVPK